MKLYLFQRFSVLSPKTNRSIVMKDVSKKPVSVFLADDDEDDVYFVKTAMREIDASVQLKHFGNGKLLLQGLAKSKNNLPDYILLDLNMPVLDGRETLLAIRKIFKKLPVIILSTSNHDHEKELCLSYGANSYYTKPCNYSLYVDVLGKLQMEMKKKSRA